MTIDIVHEIDAVHREVRDGTLAAGAARTIRMQRDYDAPIEDVWDALTNPERIGRWFLPVSGDYRLGGTYQFEGNAGGAIVACERPHRLKATWVYGEPATDADVSEIELRLTSVDEETTRFELEHTAIVPEGAWSMYGPGAVGVGWDGGLLGLSLHLRTGETLADPIAWQSSDEGRAFFKLSSTAWGTANRATGADPDAVALAVANTNAFYAPEPETP